MTTTEIEKKAEEIGLSITGVLTLAGISRATWWRWKTGRFAPRASSVVRIIRVINETHLRP
jgi:predicted transcriptional regulator